jgi:flagellar hook assembly protein FlgD
MLLPGRMRVLGVAAFLLVAAPLFGVAPAVASIIAFRATPAYFSPNGDGVQDHVGFTWTLSDSASDFTITIQVSGVSGPPILRHIDLGPRPAGLDSAQWNGTDDSAQPLSDNRYVATAIETSASVGVVPTGFAVVVLDTTPPSLPTIDGAVDTSQVQNQRVLSGFAEGADSVRVFREGLYDTTVAVQYLAPDTIYTATRTLNVGPNLFAVQSKDFAGNLSALTTTVTVRYINAPELLSARAAPTYFSPNNDGVFDTSYVNVDLDAPSTRVVVDVRAGDPPNGAVDLSTPVAHLYDGPMPGGTTVVAWDGRDSTGAPARDGAYEFRVFAATFTADGAPFNTPTLNSPIHLDTVPPGVPALNPPLPSISFRQVLLVAGSSAGADSVFVTRNGARVAEGGPSFRFEVPLAPDVNTFTLQAVDTAGNASAIAGPYDVNYETPVGFHANERFRANDAFVFNLLRPATAIDIVLYTLRGRPVRTLAARSLNTHYDVEWDGKDDLGNFAGDGPYVARARISYLDGTSAEVHGAVVLVK